MHKEITVTHLIASLATGGAEKVVLSLYKNRSIGRATIAYWLDRHELLEGCDYPVDDIVRVPLHRVISLGSIFKLVRQFKRWRPDIIQTHLPDADLLGTLVAFVMRVPVILTMHSYPFPLEKRHCLRYRIMSLFAARVIGVSNTVKKHLVEHAGIRPDKISIVNNGINLERFSYQGTMAARRALKAELGLVEGRLVVGNVSRLIDDKGHTFLLKASATVLTQFPETLFLVVGDGKERESLVAEAAQLGISKSLVFAGARTDIPQLLDIMDIFVFPTFNEALGICVIEAMAMGKAIIATNDAAVPELITHEKEGLLIPAGDAPAIAQSLLRLLRDVVLRERIAKGAAERAKDFSEQAMTRNTEKVYREIL